MLFQVSSDVRPSVADGRDICEIVTMDIEFTAATKRAIREASQWGWGGSHGVLQAPAVLLGLLAEPECRAALVLEEHGIDSASILARWSGLDRSGPSSEPIPVASSYTEDESDEMVPPFFSPETESAIAIATDWLADLPRPLTLATEHLLMGLAACDNEVGAWLRAHQVSADTLREETLKQYGLVNQPLDIEEVDTGGLEPWEEEATYLTEGKQVALSGTDHCPRSGDPESVLHANVVRLLDASANRAREALRVVEDFGRFTLDDRYLVERLKALRHQLTSALASIALSDRLAMRDTQGDVGTSVSTDTEQRRHDIYDVLAANFTRLEEALRSLEEFGKIGNSGFAQQIEQIRYDTYTLQKAVHSTIEGLQRLCDKRLYVLIDGRSSVEAFEESVSSLVEVGVDIIQLRDKTLGDRELLDRAHRLRNLTVSSETLFVMNDRPDLAVLASADGVHVGQEELAVRDVRQIVGPRMLVGVSTHNLAQARQAVLDGASYLGVGPIFPSGTKTFGEFPGLAFAEQVAREVQLPAYAIGGIEASNLDDVLATGIYRIAVSGAVISAANPARAARTLLDRLKASP